MSLASETVLTVTEALETAINLLLKQDPATLEKMAQLQGKCLAFEITGPDLTLYLFPHNEGVQIQYLYSGTPDTTLSGSPLAFIKLSAGDASESFFRGEVRIRGDIELGQKFKRLLEQLDIDWEEWLSHYSGDLFAFRAGEVVRKLNNWGKNTLSILQQDASEYLHEESRLNPGKEEMVGFSQQVSELRDAVARLEARFAQIEKQL